MKNTILRLLVLWWILGSLAQNGNSQKLSRPIRQTESNQAETLPPGISTKDVVFFSEGIQCFGKIFKPLTSGPDSKSPAVLLAPGWGETEKSIEPYAIRFALAGLVAMTIDYRGWGKSGGFLQTVDAVKTDDRLRFSQMTTRIRIRRKRLIPLQQILDIRNALYFLQGEAGVDRARVGVWGTGMAGGHIMVVAATDTRIKAVVANSPIIDGKDTPRKASPRPAALLRAEQRLARTDPPISAANTTNDIETRLALNEYHPFWYVEQIPKTIPVLFVIDGRASKGNESALEASKAITGATDLVRLSEGTTAGKVLDAAAKAASDWFLKYL